MNCILALDQGTTSSRAVLFDQVDGGAAANDLLLQFQADLLRVPVVRPLVTETTALGAAFLAGLAVGFWKNLDQLRSVWRVDRQFLPEMDEKLATHRRHRWSEALQRSRDWEQHGVGPAISPALPPAARPYAGRSGDAGFC